ncbi:MAG: hypothetical protein JAZ19_03815 [Candidatus Thiodiazotropha taylori]|nr:hypothetical protein [Candidatus Thiodiazotropha taylori]
MKNIILSVLLASSCSLYASSYTKSAYESAKSGDFQQVKETLEKGIRSNDSHSIYALGAMYLQGNIMPLNVEKGMKLLKKSGDMGIAKSYDVIGEEYTCGTLGKDIGKSIYYHKKAYDEGYIPAGFNLTAWFNNAMVQGCNNVPIDKSSVESVQKTYDYLKECAEKGGPNCQYSYSRFLIFNSTDNMQWNRDKTRFFSKQFKNDGAKYYESYKYALLLETRGHPSAKDMVLLHHKMFNGNNHQQNAKKFVDAWLDKMCNLDKSALVKTEKEKCGYKEDYL